VNYKEGEMIDYIKESVDVIPCDRDHFLLELSFPHHWYHFDPKGFYDGLVNRQELVRIPSYLQ